MKPELNETAVETGPTGTGHRTDQSAIPPVQTGDIVLWKRILDLTCLLVALPVLLPLMLVISIGVKLVSSGPILFRQERIGYRGRPFILYKFRSMEVSVDKEVHEKYMGHLMQSDIPMEKMDGASGPELISWGWLLRASGLDELPQVFNVIRGE
jgi:lipopolysaccharide/colanic/teichoic acid biosynthesis glycosyltransferase